MEEGLCYGIEGWQRGRNRLALMYKVEARDQKTRQKKHRNDPPLPCDCYLVLLRKLVVYLVGDRLQPFVGSIRTRYFEGQVGEPTVGGGPMPMLHISRDVDHRAG